MQETSEKPYDSWKDTMEHRKMVRAMMQNVVADLILRQVQHDDSKLDEPEKSMYDEYKPKIRETELKFGYGSPEYVAVVKQMGPALKHHYAANRHHPEHFENGVNGMTLMDLVEMLSDWKAASMQYGTPLNLDANRKRFELSDQLYQILVNTVKELKW